MIWHKNGAVGGEVGSEPEGVACIIFSLQSTVRTNKRIKFNGTCPLNGIGYVIN